MYTFHKKDNLPIYRAPINKNKSVYREKTGIRPKPRNSRAKLLFGVNPPQRAVRQKRDEKRNERA